MAGEERDRSGPEAGGAPQPGRPERPRLRRSPFGYRRADVDDALGARDAELALLRQDIAALWLAFAQHDRMLKQLAGEPRTRPDPAPPAAPDPATPSEQARPAPRDPEAESIGSRLSELDEVLMAIEQATRALESTYAEAPGDAGAPESVPPAAGAGEERAPER